MIKKICILNYRTFKKFVWEPQEGMNIIVGNNEAGKSTLLEAILLALNGRMNGRWLGDELNPYWFNTDVVQEYFEGVGAGKEESPPSILIELYFGREDKPQKTRGRNNSFREDCPGIKLTIEPDPDYREQFMHYISNDHPPILPVEYYQVDWRGFDGTPLKKRPIELKTSVIDGRTIRSYRGVDYQTRQMLADYIEKEESASISVAYRHARYQLTGSILGRVNTRIEEETQNISDYTFELQMDQSSAASWESSVVPQVNQVPFSMAGQGEQVLMKIALALKNSTDTTNFLIIEEPENHLSHTSLIAAVNLIDELSDGRQTFIATHSSYVLNRLGLDRLTLLHTGKKAEFAQLSKDTIDYFRRQSGYDTLRLVLARKLVIVEGPSDEMLFNRAYFDLKGRYPIDNEIDVITQGTRNRRALELCYVLDRSVAVLRDVDNRTPEHWKNKASTYLEEGKREMFIGDPQYGHTLEPQVIYANREKKSELKEIIQCPDDEELAKYMNDNKTEVAWHIAKSEAKINYPSYILNAIEFVDRL